MACGRAVEVCGAVLERKDAQPSHSITPGDGTSQGCQGPRQAQLGPRTAQPQLLSSQLHWGCVHSCPASPEPRQLLINSLE